jgi:hypothetical protein
LSCEPATTKFGLKLCLKVEIKNQAGAVMKLADFLPTFLAENNATTRVFRAALPGAEKKDYDTKFLPGKTLRITARRVKNGERYYLNIVDYFPATAEPTNSPGEKKSSGHIKNFM